MKKAPSLIPILIAFFAFLVVLLFGLLYTFDASSRRWAAESSDLLLEQTSGDVETQAKGFLREAEGVMATFADLASRGYVVPRDNSSVERDFSQSLVAHSNLGEVGLTYAEPTGRMVEGVMEFAARPRSQLTVYRPTLKRGTLITRQVTQTGSGGFVERERRRDEFGRVTPWSAPRKVDADPCEHYTFTTPVEYAGEMLWSDLHWSPRDADLPPGKRDVELSVQQAVKSRQGRFLGVVRVSLRTEQLDSLVKTWTKKDTPLVLFMCDTYGRLVTRLEPGDPIVELEDALRIQPRKTMPKHVAAALAQVKKLGEGEKFPEYWSGRLQADGQTYLASFRPLANPPDWVVGVAIPESYYLGGFERMRRQAVLVSSLIVGLILLGMAVLFWRVRKDLAFLVADTKRMEDFSFEPAHRRSFYREVQRVAEGLERAKTALRTLSKYTPVAVVREIVHTNQVPRLGGETREVTLLFTDIRNFTTHAEKLGINETANLLGDYLEVMGAGIQENHGTVLEYVGDAIVAVWNAPTTSGTHPSEACQAVLSCQAACRELLAGPSWQGRPQVVTRYGLHTAEVVVGHFGAVNRMSYRVIGDGANLASRIEGLNKLYGTEVLLTGSVASRVTDFDLREVDRVIVKGRTEPVDLFELVGRKGQTPPERLALVRRYEAALAMYREGRFAEALAAFEAVGVDPAAEVMAGRCRTFITRPPEGWTGVYTATEK